MIPAFIYNRQRAARQPANPAPQVKGRGPARYVRLLALFAAVIGLGWYARQPRNNPFAPARRITVAGQGPVTLVRIPVRNRAWGDELVILPRNMSRPCSLACRPPVTSWSLVTFGDATVCPAAFQTAPKTWTVIGTPPDTLPRAFDGWPQPQRQNQTRYSDDDYIRRLPVDSAGAGIIEVVFHTMTLYILPAGLPGCPDGFKQTFGEKADIVTVLDTRAETAAAACDCLRPYYCVAVPAFGALTDGPVRPGILSPSRHFFSYTFKPLSQGRMVLDTMSESD